MRSPVPLASLGIFCLLTLPTLCIIPVSAQQASPASSFNLVLPKGPGRVVVPIDGEWRWKLAILYGDIPEYMGVNTRTVITLPPQQLNDEPPVPVFEFVRHSAGDLDVTYALTPNPSGVPDPRKCRDRSPTLFSVLLNGKQREEQLKNIDTTSAGRPYTTVSFLHTSPGSSTPEKEVFGFFATPSTCAKIRVVKPSYLPADDQAIESILKDFTFEPAYLPTSKDYLLIANAYFRVGRSPVSAAVYYQRALDTLPVDAPINARRVIVDQLAMSYGMSGQIKQSRTVNQAAIQTDPDYPLYYYNLACADAEQGKAGDAKVHLQQAFDRKANVLPGEHLPDPTTDDSLLKLKTNKEFWAFVQTLK
jgi:hypothetical protein